MANRLISASVEIRGFGQVSAVKQRPRAAGVRNPKTRFSWSKLTRKLGRGFQFPVAVQELWRIELMAPRSGAISCTSRRRARQKRRLWVWRVLYGICIAAKRKKKGTPKKGGGGTELVLASFVCSEGSMSRGRENRLVLFDTVLARP